MGNETEIREFQENDLDAIVELSLRAWDPVYASLRNVLGDPIFFRLKPDWKEAQAEEVRASCTSEERDAFVAVVDGRPVGFVTVALNAFNERMGVIDIIGVDPDFQRRGIASQLSRHALDHMRRSGMDIAAVGTGGDPGHAPARAAYEALGFTLLPSARYLKLLDEQFASHPLSIDRAMMPVVGIVHVHLRDIETFDDIADVTAPAPVEAGDIVATAEGVFRVEVVLVSTDSPVVPVLARHVELPVAAR